MNRFEEEFRGARWHSEPPEWHWSDGALTMTTGERTDFWQDTFYGFRRDDGHFLGREAAGDFTAIVLFEAEYETLYDQAGLMLRLDAENWVKAGVEYSDGMTNFSTVVTRDGRSDWSVVGIPGAAGARQVRLTRLGGAVIFHYFDAGSWHLMRLGAFPIEGALRLGPMACSPERAGLRVRFLGFDIGPPIESPLHAG